MLPSSINLDTYLPTIERAESRVITFLRRLNLVELLRCLGSCVYEVLFCFLLWMVDAAGAD